MNENHNFQSVSNLPFHPPEDINLEVFNNIQLAHAYMEGEKIEDMKRLFNKEVIVDDQTSLDIETIKVPGFIGIADEEIITNSEGEVITNSQGKSISGHEDIVQFLDRYDLIVCTYQYNKDRYVKQGVWPTLPDIHCRVVVATHLKLKVFLVHMLWSNFRLKFKSPNYYLTSITSFSI